MTKQLLAVAQLVAQSLSLNRARAERASVGVFTVYDTRHGHCLRRCVHLIEHAVIADPDTVADTALKLFMTVRKRISGEIAQDGRDARLRLSTQASQFLARWARDLNREAHSQVQFAEHVLERLRRLVTACFDDRGIRSVVL